MKNVPQPPIPSERMTVLERRPDLAWEATGVSNPGVVRMPDQTIAMVYRGCADDDGSHLGVCYLDPEGQTVLPGTRPDVPIFEQTEESRELFPDGYADPRINQIGDEYYIWTFGRNDQVLAKSRNRYDNDFSGQYVGGRQIVAFRTNNFTSLEYLGLYGPDEFDKNAFLHPEKIAINGISYAALFHRVQYSIQVALAKEVDEFQSRELWREHVANLSDFTFAAPAFDWEGATQENDWPGQIAGGSPPIEIDASLLNERGKADQKYWLMFYNAAGQPRPGTYPKDRSTGMLLYTTKQQPNPNTQPFEIIARPPVPVLRPERPEDMGAANGDIVFATGALPSPDGEAIDVFFGSGDSSISKARFGLESLIRFAVQFDGNGNSIPEPRR